MGVVGWGMFGFGACCNILFKKSDITIVFFFAASYSAGTQENKRVESQPEETKWYINPHCQARRQLTSPSGCRSPQRCTAFTHRAVWQRARRWGTSTTRYIFAIRHAMAGGFEPARSNAFDAAQRHADGCPLII
ncbi:MAG: hypothetical protein E7K47_15195 [Acidovorax sp.]|nr:hypothetical protein [Acidovorax sp.]